MQWSTNPAVQSGVIQHVEGDTSQVMSWNMSSLNAGIGVGGIIGGLVMTHVSVQAITYTSAIIGALGLIVVFTLKNNHYAKHSNHHISYEKHACYQIQVCFLDAITLLICAIIATFIMIHRPRHFTAFSKIS